MRLKYLLITLLSVIIVSMQIKFSYCTNIGLTSEIFLQGSIDKNQNINKEYNLLKIGSYTNNEKYKAIISFNLSKIPKD